MIVDYFVKQWMNLTFFKNPNMSLHLKDMTIFQIDSAENAQTNYD